MIELKRSLNKNKLCRDIFLSLNIYCVNFRVLKMMSKRHLVGQRSLVRIMKVISSHLTLFEVVLMIGVAD